MEAKSRRRRGKASSKDDFSSIAQVYFCSVDFSLMLEARQIGLPAAAAFPK